MGHIPLGNVHLSWCICRSVQAPDLVSPGCYPLIQQHCTQILVLSYGVDHGLSNKLSYATVSSDVLFKCNFLISNFDNISQIKL